MIEEEYVIDQWKDLTFATLSKLGFKQGPIDRITKFISGEFPPHSTLLLLPI
jgi:hypothetical protein